MLHALFLNINVELRSLTLQNQTLLLKTPAETFNRFGNGRLNFHHVKERQLNNLLISPCLLSPLLFFVLLF